MPELVPIRYGRMLVSPFTFYRGAALIMASDLAATPRSGLTVQCCGDAHLSNFGVFASPERRLVFDINDFDETLPGPWEWDVKRLAVSMLIAARDNGYAVKDQERIVLETVEEYRTAMARVRRDDEPGRLVCAPGHRGHDVPGLRLAVQAQAGQADREGARQGAHQDSMAAFSKLTHVVDGQARIVADPPLIVPIDDLAAGSDAIEMFERCTSCCARTARRSSTTGACCWSSSGWSTSRARSSAWAASARAPGSRCCSAATARIRCSCR